MGGAVNDETARSERILELMSLPDTGAADPAEVKRSLAFIHDQLAGTEPPADDERADLERRLKDALWSDFSAADWITPRFLNKEGKPKFALVPTATAYARVWPAVFYDWQRSRDLARMAARLRLDKEKADGAVRAQEPHAENVLCAAVARRLDPLLDVVGREPDGSTWERVADWLEAHQLPEGARKVRSEKWSAERWCDPFFTARVLAQATWEEELKDGLSRASVPGMNLPLVGDLVAMASDLARAQKKLALTDADGWTLQGKSKGKGGKERERIGEVLPSIDGQLVKPELLKNMTAHLLLRELLTLTHQQRVTGSLWDRSDVGCSNVDKVVIHGGWGRAAELLNMKKNKATEVRETAFALSALRLRSQALGEGQLVGVWERTHGDATGPHRTVAYRGQHALVELTLMGPLGSSFIHQLDTRKGHDKRIVPVPVPSLLPPLVGSRNEHSGQLWLQLLLMRRFRDLASDLAEAGGVVIEDRDWKTLLDEAELRAGLLPSVRDAWINGTANDAPVLKAAPGGRFDLGDAYQKEREFILSGVEEGKAKAKAAMAARRRRGGK